MIQSELIADAKDIVGQMADLAQTWTAEAGTPSFQVLMGMPQVTADLQAGGFMERVNHEVRIVAETASWTTAYGSVCAAALSSGSPVASLAIGKTLIATEQGSRKYRIEGSTYKPGSAWVILQVRAQEER
jgi:hypothetical protein